MGEYMGILQRDCLRVWFENFLPIKTFQMRMWQYLLVVLSLMAFQQVTEGREQPARLSTRPACTYRPKFFDGENKCYKKGGVCNVNLRKNCKAVHCVDKCCKGLKCSKEKCGFCE